MCGIAGVLALGESNAWTRDHMEAVIEKMGSAIDHRGPDDRGVWLHSQGHLALGHRRLSIVDLSARGHQPMSYRGRFKIVFNGEIYNFRKLRDQLADVGHTFASDTDTEVVMAAVGEWGIEGALRLMTGMFAFALWDEQEHALYLARDRLGEKPLHLAIVQGHLVFGSELRAIECAMTDNLTLNPSALYGYLQNGYVGAPLSMWQGIFKLLPATYIKFSAHKAGLHIDDVTGDLGVSGDAVYRRYWSPPASAIENRTLAVDWCSDALERLESLLSSAVELQMQCDVPMGVFLSGGIDSTVVAALAQLQSAAPISTYTIKFDVPGYDESQHAAAVAAHLGTRHHEIVIDPQTLVKQVPRLAGALDEPTANASYFPLHLMAAEARRTVKVILSGDGGDEVFGGYNRYRLTLPLWKRVSKMPSVLRIALAAVLERVPHAALAGIVNHYQISGQSSSAVFVKKLLRVLRSQSLADSYQHLMWCWDDPQKIARVPLLRRGGFQCSNDTFLTDAMRFDLMTYLPDDNLAKGDRATMAAGLEARVPLLDHHVVEFALGLPDTIRINAGTTKWLLRQLAYKHVPQNLLDRPKMGFTVPLRQWLTGPLRDWATDLLQSRAMRENGLLRMDSVGKEWQAFQRRESPLSWELWSLVMYAAWLDSKTNQLNTNRMQ